MTPRFTYSSRTHPSPGVRAWLGVSGAFLWSGASWERHFGEWKQSSPWLSMGKILSALASVREPSLQRALDEARLLAQRGTTVSEAAERLGTSGYVLATTAFATFCFLRFGDEPLHALAEAIGAGGDTDSIAAILGAWLGALHGEKGLPCELLDRIHDGPFGPSHLRLLSHALARVQAGEPAETPPFSAAAALGRNLALFLVILAHGFRRLLPF